MQCKSNDNILLCRNSRHFYSAVSASEDFFFDFALYKCSHYITLHYISATKYKHANCFGHKTVKSRKIVMNKGCPLKNIMPKK